MSLSFVFISVGIEIFFHTGFKFGKFILINNLETICIVRRNVSKFPSEKKFLYKIQKGGIL